MIHTYIIVGMHCHSCVEKVTNAGNAVEYLVELNDPPN